MFFGFGISGFRSFGPDPQYIAPLNKINVFAGRNNSGKSNILRALRLGAAVAQRQPELRPYDVGLDSHRGPREASLKLHLPVTPTWLREKLAEQVRRGALHQESFERVLGMLQSVIAACPAQYVGAAWFTYADVEGKTVDSPTVAAFPADQAGLGRWGPLTVHEWHELWSQLTGQSGGDIHEHHIPQIIEILSPAGKLSVPAISDVDAHRKIGAEENYEGLNGVGLIKRLGQLKNPTFAKYTVDIARFEKVNSFVATVLGEERIELDVSREKLELLVKIQGKVLPIESFGTGLQQLIIFAVAATAVDDKILTLEEPEVHMHPRLQKKLIAYLRDQTKNQYLITTHSAHLLDDPSASLFHVSLNQYGETLVERVDAASRRASVCFDLGYRPSDLVQANAIIWVEGPSDRIYINAWMRVAARELVEGLHYAIMFYGGRLLSHLTVSDDAVAEFIELQRLNRQVAIVIDSDKKKRADGLNATKTRVKNETEQHGGLVWVTAGREMENYIDPATMASALREVHPTREPSLPTTEFQCAYATQGKAFTVDKLALAKAAVREVTLDRLDLTRQMADLAQFVRRANE